MKSTLDVYVFAKPNSMLFAPEFTLLLSALLGMYYAAIASVGFALVLAFLGVRHLRENRLLASYLVSAVAVVLAWSLLPPFVTNKWMSESWLYVLDAVLWIVFGAVAAGIFVSLQLPLRRV